MTAMPKETASLAYPQRQKFKQHDSLAAKKSFRLLQNLANATEKNTPRLRN
jgi:hypothetical protein